MVRYTKGARCLVCPRSVGFVDVCASLNQLLFIKRSVVLTAVTNNHREKAGAKAERSLHIS